jgi:hypothetical protein
MIIILILIYLITIAFGIHFAIFINDRGCFYISLIPIIGQISMICFIHASIKGVKADIKRKKEGAKCLK